MSSNNPAGSTAMVDLFYNAGNLDKALNSDQDHWRDRFGKERITYAYMEKLANTQALVNQSRESLRRSYAEVGLNLVPGSFEQGGTLESETDVLLEEKSGKVYGWEGAFPKVVDKNTDPKNISGFSPLSDHLLSNDLTDGALELREARFALRDIVSLDDFDDPDDNIKFNKAFDYLLSNYGGGGVLIPPRTYNASIEVPSNITLMGFGEKSVIKSTKTGLNSYAVKLSNAVIGTYPYGTGRSPIKNVRIKNVTIDATGADFGIYASYCLFLDLVAVNISNANVRNLFMTAVFSYSIDKMILSQCQKAGGSIGENIFSWTGGEEGIICNGGNIRRLMTFGNGVGETYNKVSNPKGGAGLIVSGGSGNNFLSYHGEANKGTGLYVMPMTQSSFYGIYLEENANDGSAEFRQVVNESAIATFYDVEPRFRSTDVFHAVSNTYINNYLGQRITGPGYVSLSGKFSNVSVETPLVHTIKLSEATNVDSAGASTRHTMLKPSRYSSVSSFKTRVWQMGVFIAFRSSQSIPNGRNILVRTLSGTTLLTLPVPTGTYSDGDVVYLPMLVESTAFENISVANIGYGAGWVGIGQIDIGFYMQLMV